MVTQKHALLAVGFFVAVSVGCSAKDRAIRSIEEAGGSWTPFPGRVDISEETDATDAILEQLKYIPKLRELDIRGIQITDSGMTYLKELNDLHSLHLRSTQVTDAGLDRLKEVIGVPQESWALN